MMRNVFRSHRCLSNPSELVLSNTIAQIFCQTRPNIWTQQKNNNKTRYHGRNLKSQGYTDLDRVLDAFSKCVIVKQSVCAAKLRVVFLQNFLFSIRNCFTK